METPTTPKRNTNVILHIVNMVGWPAIAIFVWQYVLVPQINDIINKAGYVKIDQVELMLNNSLKEKILEERERQADEHTGSLSWNISRELERKGLGVPREQVAPLIAEVAVWGLERREEYAKQQSLWQEFESTRYIGIIQKEFPKLHYRWIDGDYLIRSRAHEDKVMFYWIDGEGVEHYLAEISNINKAY